MRIFNSIGTVGYVATTPFQQERFSFSFAEMAAYNTRHLEKEDRYVYYEREHVSLIPTGRNNLVNKLRGDWLLMLDSDLEFDPDLLERMLYIMNKYEAPIVCGLYVYKKKPFYPVVYSYNSRKAVYEVVAKWEGNPEIFQVDAAGAGCLLVKKFVFDMIRKDSKQEPFDIIGRMGEDFSFFHRARNAGIGVYLAPQIRLSHMGIEGHDYDLSFIDNRVLTKPYERDGK